MNYDIAKIRKQASNINQLFFGGVGYYDYICIMKTTKVSGIYILRTSIDDRVYIGSAVSLAHRKGTHFHQLRNNKHHNIHLQNFANKYGVDKITFEVLELCPKKNLVKMEQYYLNVYENKFNLLDIAGSSLGRVCGLETRRKISNSLKRAGLKGLPKSKKTRERMRKPKSKEHSNKIKIAQRDVIKTVYQYNFNLELIDVFESITEAGAKTGLDRRQISACCNETKQKTVKGFVFTFKPITDFNKYKIIVHNSIKYSKK